MGKLALYGPGEIFDRLTILQLKMRAGIAQGKPIGHFVQEETVLHDQLPAIIEPYTELHARLAGINAALWQQEDLLRRQRRTEICPRYMEDWKTIARTAFRIQELNDQRAETIAAINRAAGRSDGAEKL